MPLPRISSQSSFLNNSRSPWNPSCLVLMALCLAAMTILSTMASATTPQFLPKLDADGPLEMWQEKNKLFLVIAVDQTGIKGTELPFAAVDGGRVAMTLEALGYSPLIEGEPVLLNPTQNRLVEALQEIRELPGTASVVLYYSGHGVVDPQEKDVWLQLAGQSKIRDHLGVSVSQLIENARGVSYRGELHIIVDACFSGRGAYTGGLTLKDLGNNTTILTSSSETQNSYPMRGDGGTKLSAFTYTLLEGWGPDWLRADDNHDGLLSFKELASYSDMRLQELYQNKAITGKMRPQLLGSHDDHLFLSYRADQVKNRCSTARTVLTVRRIEKIQEIIQMESLALRDPLGKPDLSAAVKALARSLCGNQLDQYVLALKAQADGQFEQATEFLEEAERKIDTEEVEIQREEREAREARSTLRDRKVKVYLARARNEVYGNKYDTAIGWYEKILSIQPTRDAELLLELGAMHLQAGRYDKAQSFLKEALALTVNTLSPNDPDLALYFQGLGSIYFVQGNYAEAEPLYKRAIGIREAALGPNHPDVAGALGNLAELYRQQGKYSEAEPLFKRALGIAEAALGADHEEVAIVVSNLEGLYFEQAKYEEAEAYYQRALRIQLAALGPDHPAIATDLNNLAEVYRQQGKYAEAEPLYQRAVRISEASLGANHPELATVLVNVAELYREQEKYPEAERLYQRALRIDEAALGDHSPNVSRDIHDLAALYHDQRKYAEAKPLYQRSLRIYEAILGPNHPRVAVAASNLAGLYQDEGNYADADPLYRRAYEILKSQFGLSHPNTKTVLMNYANFLRKHGDKEKLEDLYPDIRIAVP
jgi:tetratricopeptide (TPR) repeat protein